MIELVILASANLATELLKNAESIVGKKTGIIAIDAGLNESGQFKTKLTSKINTDKEVLVFTDLLGTPHASALIDIIRTDKKKIRIITGVNLSMVIAAAKARSKGELNINEIARQVREQAIKSIMDSEEFLG